MELEIQRIKSEETRLRLEKNHRDLQEAERERNQKQLDLKMIDEQLIVLITHFKCL
jgi:hypothetical protein